MSADQSTSQGQVMTPSATSNQSPTKHPSTPPTNNKFTYESPVRKQQLQQLQPQMPQHPPPAIQQQAIPSLQPQQSYHQLKVPSTPSTKRTSGIFDTPSVLQTPERTPQQLLNEGTPLLSPSITYSVHSSSQKRKSTDFYSLLRSPEVSRYTTYDKAILGSPDVKRRSMELNKIINKTSPEKNIGSVPSSPGFIFHDTMLSSPKRISPYRISKKNEVEIKEISENLKTRLNYAKLKIQHGWSNNTISELEQKLQDDTQVPINPSDNNKYNEFWSMKSDTLPGGSGQHTPHQRKRPLTTPVLTTGISNTTTNSPRRSSHGAAKFNLDDVATHKQGNSAETALFKALSPEKAKLNHSKLPSTGTSDEKLEQEAIMSLMSLSSPVKYSASSSPSPPEKATFHRHGRKTSIPTSSTGTPAALPSNPLLVSASQQNQHNPRTSHSRNPSYQLSKPPHLPPPSIPIAGVTPTHSPTIGGFPTQRDGDETEDETDIEPDDEPSTTTGLGIRPQQQQLQIQQLPSTQAIDDGEETASEHSENE